VAPPPYVGAGAILPGSTRHPGGSDRHPAKQRGTLAGLPARECVVAQNRAMTTTTTFPDSHRDLLEAQVATLATINGRGYPQLTEVWFLYEDGQLKLSLNTSRLKTRNLMRRPRCSLLLLDLQNPYRYLEVRGEARIAPDADREFARRVGAKYGADLSVHDRPEDSRVIVTIEPVNVYAVDMRAS